MQPGPPLAILAVARALTSRAFGPIFESEGERAGIYAATKTFRVCGAGGEAVSAYRPGSGEMAPPGMWMSGGGGGAPRQWMRAAMRTHQIATATAASN
jgi:hypothetical protein